MAQDQTKGYDISGKGTGVILSDKQHILTTKEAFELLKQLRRQRAKAIEDITSRQYYVTWLNEKIEELTNKLKGDGQTT